MAVVSAKPERSRQGIALQMARVLLVQDGLASRLALQTLLEAGGYGVDVAASASEAFGKLDSRQYELVLSEQGIESQGGILAYARIKDYRPATALITSYQNGGTWRPTEAGEQQVSVSAEDVSSLLSKVAHLIGVRASRRSERARRG